MSHHPIDAWHEFVHSRDPGVLEKLLADDVVFHSPVVHTPQRGRAITLLYLRGAMEVLGSRRSATSARSAASAMRCSSSSPRSTASRSTGPT